MDAKTENDRRWLRGLPVEPGEGARVRFDTPYTRLHADGWLVE
jgi:hypothetical protein